MIKCVVFDIDGTLYDFYGVNPLGKKAIAEYAAKNLGIDEDDFMIAHEHAMDEINRTILIDNPARHDRTVRYKYILEQLGAPLSHVLPMYEIYWNTILDNMVAEPGIKEFFEYIKAKGLKIGIGSNMTLRMQLIKLTRLGLIDLTDFVVTSEESVLQKPHPYFFKHVTERSGFSPSEIAFIGDDMKHDVKPSTENGMTGIWYNPKGKEGESKYIIKDYRECIKDNNQIPI